MLLKCTEGLILRSRFYGERTGGDVRKWGTIVLLVPEWILKQSGLFTVMLLTGDELDLL